MNDESPICDGQINDQNDRNGIGNKDMRIEPTILYTVPYIVNEGNCENSQDNGQQEFDQHHLTPPF
jgi:hypothetical protein